MRRILCPILAAAAMTGLAACAVSDHDYHAYPDDYRTSGDHRGAPDSYRNDRHGPSDRYVARDRADRYGDRDGDGVLNWRDRYPDDPRRF